MRLLLKNVTRPLPKTALTSLTMCSILLLTACSQSRVVNTLQKDFDQHKYSEYVKANLQTKTPVTTASNIPQMPTLALAKRQSNGSRKARANLNGVIANNGLFKPIADNTSVETLAKKASLNTVLNMALTRNLDIKSAQQQAQASLSKYNQVEYLSDMLAQYEAFTNELALTGSAKASLSKNKSAAYPSPGLNAIKSSIIDESVKYSRLKLKQTTQDTITNARIAYTEMQTAQREMVLQSRLTSQYKSLKEELQNNYATNTGGLDDILQADIEIAASQNKRRVAKDKRDAQQARLNALLNIPTTTRFGGLDKLGKASLIANRNEITQQAHKHRVEIALLESELAKMQRVIQLSERQLYPDLDAGFSRTQNGKFTTKPKIKTNNFFARNDAYLEETKQKAKALTSKIAALKNTTSDELQQTLSNYQSHQSTYTLYRNNVIPKAKASLDIARNAFETGESDNVKVIKAQIAITKYRLLLLNAQSGMEVSRYKAERLIGFRLK
ncbi:TolC family protein [Cocleimonas flava]|uniref:Outer membrane protein TolC n=2 Tax=Cocleimonas flava TaxID=634765 RepID=A0A4V2P7U7_9GAMM|nr:TolC family protein [Cocleimonas flava]TCJ83215.1 outer membrane protein TolC [Cocleimonas flava]